MKKTGKAKRWIVFILVLFLAVSASITSSDLFLRAAEEYEEEEVGGPADPVTEEVVKVIKVADRDETGAAKKPQDVYVYLAFTGVDTANVTKEFLGEKYKYSGTILEEGGKLWYTAGVIRDVLMSSEPEKPVGDSVCYASEEDKRAALDRLSAIDRFGDEGKNELPIPSSSDGNWSLKGASGAMDYDTDYNVEHPARWHLDGLVDLSRTVLIKYRDEKGTVIETRETEKMNYGAVVSKAEMERYAKTIDNYVFDKCLTESLVVGAAEGQDVIELQYRYVPAEGKGSNVYAYVEIAGLDETDEEHRGRVEAYYGLDGLWQGRYYPVGVIENVPLAHGGDAADIPGALTLWDTMKALKVKDAGAIKAAVEGALSEEEKPGGWSLKNDSGANGFEEDYPDMAAAGNACWHLDGVIDLARSADLVYLDENGSEVQQKGSVQTAAFKTIDDCISSLNREVPGYSWQETSVYRNYGSADQSEVTGENGGNVIAPDDDLTIVLRYRSTSQSEPAAADGGGDGGGRGGTPAVPSADLQPTAVPDVPAPAGRVQLVLPGELVSLGEEEVPLRGAQTETEEDGNVKITVIGEEEVPLAGGVEDLPSHCMMHFLLMSAALIIFAVCMGRLKKYQKTLARLRDDLSEM